MVRITHGPHNAWMHNAQHIRNTFFKFTKTVRFVSWTFCNWTFGKWRFCNWTFCNWTFCNWTLCNWTFCGCTVPEGPGAFWLMHCQNSGPSSTSRSSAAALFSSSFTGERFSLSSPGDRCSPHQHTRQQMTSQFTMDETFAVGRRSSISYPNNRPSQL